MNGDDRGWIEGALVAATLVIQIGSAVRDGRQVQAQPQVILTSH